MYYNVTIFLNIIRYFANLQSDCFAIKRRFAIKPNVNLFIRIDIYPANLGTMILFNVEVCNFSIFSNNLSKNHDIFGAVNSLCM